MTAEAVTSPAADRSPEVPRSRRRWLRRYSPREVLLALALLAPSIAVFVVFFYRPFLNLLNWGRFESRRNGAYFEDVGLAQYREALGSDDFREGLWHSVQFVLYTVPAGLVLGVLLAVAAHRRLRGIKVFQAIFSSTLASSTAVTSVIFFYLFNPVVGLIEANWLNDPDMAMVAVSISSIWQNMGLSFVIVLAGLQAVPDEVMEAALLDGYGAVRRLVRITLPLISPVLLFLLVVLVIFGLQAFAQIDIITKGGPVSATETLVFKINRLNRPDNIGIGAVYSIGLFLVTLVVTALQFAILERRVHYAR
ncbi:MAG: sugar ABC transporter permease [Thermoanaerobacterales bacterium]|nr:sugar ABC transporter permease [Thermoanaerobacterales bacterium]